MDAPVFGSVEELLLLAEDREAWRLEVKDLLGEADPARSAKGGSDGGKRSKKNNGLSDAFWLAGGFHWEDGEWKPNC